MSNTNNKHTLLFREAKQSDLSTLIKMLADDKLGAQRETISNPVDQAYLNTFESINNDPNNELIVVENIVEENIAVQNTVENNSTNDTIIGMLQLTFIPYLSHKGAWRCLIESVRIHKDYRGQGLGSDVFKWATQRAKDRNCTIVQLTSDKKRPDAIRFYENLGFKASHEGFKLLLNKN